MEEFAAILTLSWYTDLVLVVSWIMERFRQYATIKNVFATDNAKPAEHGWSAKIYDNNAHLNTNAE